MAMKLAELTAYAGEKYGIREQHKWADFPGFSVLCHPRTGKWVALLMRQWDMETGAEIERCDLNCGQQSLRDFEKPYLFLPLRMKGEKWIGVAFTRETEPEVVFLLFDRAIASGEQRGFTIVLDAKPSPAESVYRDTALPFSGSACRPPEETVPERIRQMRRLFEYGRESMEDKAKNFYRQAVFMRDYEDDVPWTGDFFCYFPTYRDLTTRQLRGYFSWRARVRKGEYRPIATSAAYLYVYELLNGIGAESPEDALRRLKAFEAGYLDSGIGDKRMRQNLHRWMLEYAVLQDVPPELARQYADPELMEKDRALSILRSPEDYPDEEIFSALCRFDVKKLAESPVVTADPERGKRLLGEAWRAASGCCRQEQDLFTLCFGKRRSRRWYPLANAVYFWQGEAAERTYLLDECRSYRCSGGVWQVEAYERLDFDRERFQGFLHEADAKLRRYLKTGRYLREKPEYAWAAPCIDAVIEADRQAVLAASRPKITIDLSGLEQIREDAVKTRDSLLTDEELGEPDVSGEIPEKPPEADPPDVPLDAVQIRILRTLLRNGDAADIMRENHLMPSLVADCINEALFDGIGDTVLSCEDDRLSLVEDYAEDLTRILGEHIHE